MRSPIETVKTLRQYNISFVEDYVVPERPRSIDKCIEQNELVMRYLREKVDAVPRPNKPTVVDFNLALSNLRESYGLLEDAAKADASGQRWKASKLIVQALECSDRARRLTDLMDTEDVLRNDEGLVRKIG